MTSKPLNEMSGEARMLGGTYKLGYSRGLSEAEAKIEAAEIRAEKAEALAADWERRYKSMSVSRELALRQANDWERECKAAEAALTAARTALEEIFKLSHAKAKDRDGLDWPNRFGLIRITALKAIRASLAATSPGPTESKPAEGEKGGNHVEQKAEADPGTPAPADR